MVVVGPITRYAVDLLPLFKVRYTFFFWTEFSIPRESCRSFLVISTFHFQILVDPKKAPALKLNEKVDVRKLKYYYIRESGEHKCTPVAKELQANMTKVIKHFESIAETKPVEIKLHGTEQATRLWRYWMTQEPASFSHLLGNGKRLNPFVELAKKLTFTSDFTMGAIYSLIDDVLPKENADKMKEVTRKCDEELTVNIDLFGAMNSEHL